MGTKESEGVTHVLTEPNSHHSPVPILLSINSFGAAEKDFSGQ
jgi:hypothetical protein